MLASLAAAVLAALCYGVASVMQAVAVRAESRREHTPADAGNIDLGLLARLLGQWRFVASVVIDLLGFLAQVIALRKLPLFAVQAMVAANLAVIAALAAFVLAETPKPREWLAVAGVVAGVALLGSSAGAEGANRASLTFKVALIIATAAVAGCGVAATRLGGHRVRGHRVGVHRVGRHRVGRHRVGGHRAGGGSARTLLLGTVAGLGYGLIGIAARVLTGFAPLTLLTDPAAYAVVGAGIVSFVFYTTALDGGSVTVATAAVVLAETLPPAVIGVLFLGDTTRAGLAPVAWAGFVLAVVSAILLARFGEPEPALEREPDQEAGPIPSSRVT
jgi:drug/metabolite transporter (DMT)-like permease